MRVTYKLTIVLVLAMSAVLLTYAWLSVRSEVDLIESDMQRDAGVLGGALGGIVRQVWLDQGEAAAIALVDGLPSDPAIALRWVRPGATDALHAPRHPDRLAGLAPGSPIVVLDRDAGPDGTHTSYIPVLVADDALWALEVTESLASEREVVLGTIRRVAFTTFALVAVFGVVALVAGARVVGRPAQALVEMARRVGQGDLTWRLAQGPRDELGDLAREMNAMADRLVAARARIEAETAAREAAIDQLRQADRLVTVGKLAAGVAHELGTPLNVVQGRARLIAAGGLTAAEVAENAGIIAHQAERMGVIIRQLLDYGRRRSAHKAPHDVRALARRTTEMLSELARRRKVELRVPEDRTPLTMAVDGGQLEQVLTNLVVNAIHASPEGGVVDVEVAPATRPDRPGVELVELAVTDRGVGIPEEDVPRLYEPFFTTKAVGEGVGLGLPVTHGIVTDHGGWIEVESAVGRGSTFRVLLPRQGGPAERRDEAGPA